MLWKLGKSEVGQVMMAASTFWFRFKIKKKKNREVRQVMMADPNFWFRFKIFKIFGEKWSRRTCSDFLIQIQKNMEKWKLLCFLCYHSLHSLTPNCKDRMRPWHDPVKRNGVTVIWHSFWCPGSRLDTKWHKMSQNCTKLSPPPLPPPRSWHQTWSWNQTC